jgi:GNAT superfamily N-acetyltransferase
MYVPPPLRGLGIGQALLDREITYARLVPGILLIKTGCSKIGSIGPRVLFERDSCLQYGLEPYALRVGSEFAPKIHMWKYLNRGEAGPGDELVGLDACQ